MGNLKKTFKMRWDAILIYVILLLLLVVLFAIGRFGGEFFFAYKPLIVAFSLLQLLCIGLMIAIGFYIWYLYRKVGNISFYEHGILFHQSNESYFYHDIINYHFLAQNNKHAKVLYFKTDDDRENRLTALLPKEAFEMFQEDHAKIWVPFLMQQIEDKQIVTFELQEDVTSFKMDMSIHKAYDDEISVSHQGIILYDTFYKWEDLSRFDVTFTGMLLIKDKQNKTVFFEPMTCLSQYMIFISLLSHYIQPMGVEDNHD